MTEYIVKKTDNGFKVLWEFTRCRDCVLKEKNPESPFLVNCNFYKKSQPGNGFCHLGERGENGTA